MEQEKKYSETIIRDGRHHPSVKAVLLWTKYKRYNFWKSQEHRMRRISPHILLVHSLMRSLRMRISFNAECFLLLKRREHAFHFAILAFPFFFFFVRDRTQYTLTKPRDFHFLVGKHDSCEWNQETEHEKWAVKTETGSLVPHETSASTNNWSKLISPYIFALRVIYKKENDAILRKTCPLRKWANAHPREAWEERSHMDTTYTSRTKGKSYRRERHVTLLKRIVIKNIKKENHGKWAPSKEVPHHVVYRQTV